MEWAEEVATTLGESGVDVVAHVPDSASAELVDRIEASSEFTALGVTREEEGAAVISGTWLAGKRGALICQSSGLANTFNALCSLNKAARIPFVGFVTRRGGSGEFNYAQVPFGYNMDRVLDDLGFRYESIDDTSDVSRSVSWGVKTAFETGEPYFLILEPSLLGIKDE